MTLYIVSILIILKNASGSTCMSNTIIFNVYATSPHTKVIPATIRIIVILLSLEKFLLNLAPKNAAKTNAIPFIPYNSAYKKIY